MNVYHISKDNYQQYAPFDIVAVDESFRKLYDRSVRMFRLDFDNPPPVDEIISGSKGATLGEAFDNDEWLKIEKMTTRAPQKPFRYFIHNSIKDEYLKYTGGELRWDSQIVYGILVHHQRTTLTSKNYQDFALRRMLAMSSEYDVIDEYGDWFWLNRIKTDEVRAVFSNYDEFNFNRDETFFHMGLGTGIWVDRSIVDQFREETTKLGYPDRGNHILHPVWNELVWKIIEENKK